jgi:hypothetical protein
MLLHLALSKNDVSKIVLGPLSEHTVQGRDSPMIKDYS